MKTKYKSLVWGAVFVLTGMGCADQLNINPKGVLSNDLLLGNPDHVEGFITAAYSYIPNLDWGSAHAWWMHGSIRSDDAYKGGSGVNDQTPWHDMEVFSSVTPSVGNNDAPWTAGYFSISRYHMALKALSMVDEADFPMKSVRIGEIKFLRGTTYFFMKTLWRYIPWVEESEAEDKEAVTNTPNRPNGTDDSELWNKIVADLEEAVRLLPESQSEIGRVNKNAARAMAAKTLLYMAYEQDERHQVVNINKGVLERALVYLNEITDQEGSAVGLCEDIAENFLPEYDNRTQEGIWEIQYSISDGTSDGGNTNNGAELNAPSWEPYFPCCDFHKISFNLANAFRTDASGLPLFDTFNDAEMKNRFDQYFAENTFDPRFSHTMAVPGHPYKYNEDLLFETNAARSPGDYGYLKSIKELVPAFCDCIIVNRNSMNVKNVRYAEVLLWKAEILIQLDRHKEALSLINKLRERSNNSRLRLVTKEGKPYLNYNVGLYPDDATWTKEYAWKALMFENRLETAGEGRRFFDLMRWGILEPTMNAYFAKEKTRFSWMDNAIFVAGRDEYKPISQLQMNWSRGYYTQNPGY